MWAAITMRVSGSFTHLSGYIFDFLILRQDYASYLWRLFIQQFQHLNFTLLSLKNVANIDQRLSGSGHSLQYCCDVSQLFISRTVDFSLVSGSHKCQYVSTWRPVDITSCGRCDM